jgi:hypothetical protein
MHQSKERSKDDLLFRHVRKIKTKTLVQLCSSGAPNTTTNEMRGPTSTSIVVHRLEFCCILPAFFHGLDRIPPSGGRAAVGCSSEDREVSCGWAGERELPVGRAGQRGGGDKGPYLDSCMAREGGSVADNTNAAHHRSPFLLERSSSSLAMAATSFTAASVPSCSSSAVKVRNNNNTNTLLLLYSTQLYCTSLHSPPFNLLWAHLESSELELNWGCTLSQD